MFGFRHGRVMRVRLSWYTVARQNEYQSLEPLPPRVRLSLSLLARSLACRPHATSRLCDDKCHNSFQAPPTLAYPPLRLAPSELKFFTLTLCFTGLYSVLVMSARKRKERSSDSQIFDSIQGNCPRVILSVCHTSGPFFFFPAHLCRKQQTTPHKISSSESKLNLITARTRKALIQLSSPSFTNFQLCPNVSSFYVPIRASPC